MRKNKGIRILALGLPAFVLFLISIASFYYVPEIPLEILNRKYGVDPSQYIEVEGIQVHYRVDGVQSDSIPLVLLHGTSSSLYTWNDWTDLLKDEHQLIRLDLPGYGLTGPRLDDDYSVSTYLNFLQSFLAKLGIKQCILIGNSIGGEIAWRYALHNSAQVHKLVLIDAAGYPIKMDQMPLSKLPLSYLWMRIPLVNEMSVKFITPNVTRKSLEYLYGNPKKVTASLVDLYFDMMHREGNRKALTERMESFSRSAPWEKVSNIKIPTLLIWGKEDRLIPVENALLFHKELPDSKLFIFPEAGHMPMEEIPAQSAIVLKKFIDN